MKILTKHLWFNTNKRQQFINLTSDIEKLVYESAVKDGLCLVNAMHITASVFINDDEGGLHKDFDKWLEKIAPHEPLSQYRHNDTGEDMRLSEKSLRKRKFGGRATWQGAVTTRSKSYSEESQHRQ